MTSWTQSRCAAVLVLVVLGTSFATAWESKDPPSLPARLQRVRNILTQVPLVDGHNDFATNLRELLLNQLTYLQFDQNLTEIEPWVSSPYSYTDLPRLRAGQVGAQFWAAWVPCGSQYKNSVAQVFEQIDVIQRFIQRYPKDLQLVTTSQGILDAHAAGKVGSLIGVESGHTIDSSLGVLRQFYRAGVRYMTLTHVCNTPWADNSRAEDGSDGSIEFNGLTPWGENVVKEMNRLGMFVDISHVASQTMRDVLDITRSPVIASHSNARAVYNHTRNIPDDVLLRMADNGGLVMVNFYPYYLTKVNGSIDSVIEHINHIRAVAGIDHVGIGSDFDGIEISVDGLEDVSRYPYLLAELALDPNWSDDDIKKLAGLNLIRAFNQMEQVSALLVSEEPWDTPIPLADLTNHLNCTYIWPEPVTKGLK